MRGALVIGVLVAAPALAQPAFPGAEGPGAAATGGRGGRVIKVTTLAASGPGSLQAALDASGPRIVLFAVSGVIDGHLRVAHGDLTVAGQSAPGAGITIAGQLTSDTTEGNIILRHLRVRPPPRPGNISGNQYDALQLWQQTRLIVDHCSIAWGVDETVDFYESNDVTIQWSTIEESVSGAGHPDGANHNYGLIQGPDGRRIAVHHNLFAHHLNRCPAVANGPADVRNNVVYNVRHGFVHHNPASGPFNIVGNYYRQGPDNTLIPFYFDDENMSPAPDLRYHLAGNFIDDPADNCARVVDDPWSDACHPSFSGLNAPASLRAPAAFDFASTVPGWVAVTTHPAQQAYDLVLERAGAFPRDAVTTRIVDEVRARTGGFSTQPGDRPADLLGGLVPGAPPADGDGDGMPDAWEQAHGLDPQSDDSAKPMPSGYTAIEDYLNELADGLAGLPPGDPDGGSGGAGGSGGTGGTGGNPATGDGGGCGCTLGAAPPAGSLLLLALVALALRRRRA